MTRYNDALLSLKLEMSAVHCLWVKTIKESMVKTDVECCVKSL